MTTPIIELENISFRYPGAYDAVLNSLDLKVMPGDRIGLMAPNGSGKTTLLHTIMGLCRPQEGNIRIFGTPMETEADFTGIRTRLGLLFQDSDDQLFCPSVLEDVAFGPLNLGESRKTARETAISTLDSLGISDLQDRITHRLSGGQKRLVALAAVLAMKPEVLLLDEPTSGLDSEVKQTLTDILNRLDISYLIISHEFDFLNGVAERIFSMENGQVLTDEEIHVHHHEHVHRHGRHPHVHK
ncbi:MAG: energy-coupling factor ABC transporter ATP-binding protein [Desulfobacterales bacterium]|nr:energy-coupling factor ABC transporter ATP-binding protein [Desulfobacterales bacterium]